MKGYFAQLAHHTGLEFGSGGTNSSLARPTVSAQHETQQETAPLDVASVTFITPPHAAVSAVSHEQRTSIAPVAAMPPSDEANHAVNSAGDISVTRRIELRSSLPGAGNASAWATNDLTPVALTEMNPQSSVEEKHAGFTNPEPKHQPPFEAQSLADIQGTVQFSELSTVSSNSPSNSSAQAAHDILIETVSLPSPQESGIRFTSSNSRTSQPQENSVEGRQRFVDLPEQPAFAQNSDPEELLAGVEVFDRQFVAPEYMQRDLRDLKPPARRSQAEGQELLQVINGRAQPPVLDEPREQEAIAHNYINEVLAWVTATPTDEIALEQDAWPLAERERKDVFAFEEETDAASFPLSDRTEPQVQDLSLSIGNISIVIEEPKTTPPVLPPIPSSPGRSSESPRSEPTNLSRYYLRPF